MFHSKGWTLSCQIYVKVPVKKEKIEVSKHIDMIKPDSLADYINLIDQQSKQ